VTSRSTVQVYPGRHSLDVSQTALGDHHSISRRFPHRPLPEVTTAPLTQHLIDKPPTNRPKNPPRKPTTTTSYKVLDFPSPIHATHLLGPGRAGRQKPVTLCITGKTPAAPTRRPGPAIACPLREWHTPPKAWTTEIPVGNTFDPPPRYAPTSSARRTDYTKNHPPARTVNCISHRRQPRFRSPLDTWWATCAMDQRVQPTHHKPPRQ